ncbi:MAG: FG-GAP repeat protein [Phycisphaerales bacterium]|nr:FG-GAP repeat protein [Phycisphaerales bacterium]
MRNRLCVVACAAAVILVTSSSSAQWFNEGELAPGPHGSDNYGNAVSVCGDTAVVGASGDDDQGTNAGAAYIFFYGPNGWQSEAKVYASEPSAGSLFGRSVAAERDCVVVGHLGANGSAGAVYVFEKVGDTWGEPAKLVAADGMGQDYFGSSVAVCGDTIVVGAPGANDPMTDSGAVYIFKRTNGSWEQAAKLTLAGGEEFDNFGNAVAISGTEMIAGAPGRGTEAEGEAYIYSNAGGGWHRTAILADGNATPWSYFGLSVDIDAGWAVVGAPLDNDSGIDSGSAHVYRKGGSGWVEDAVLFDDEGTSGDRFGQVAIWQGTIVAGAPFHDGAGSNAGAVFVFSRDASDWGAPSRFTLVSATGTIGNSVAIDNGAAVLGAQGAKKTFGLRQTGADSDGDGLLDEWERPWGGIDGDGDGVPDLILYELGARPDRKDIFLEVDLMNGVSEGNGFSQEGLDLVVSAFANAPIQNVDGSTGVQLHAMVDTAETGIPYKSPWAGDWSDFDDNKSLGTPAERLNSPKVVAAKHRAFRYLLVVDAIEEPELGAAEPGGGNDMFVGLGGLPDSLLTRDRSFSWWFGMCCMHELGHLLGLEHGGGLDPDPDNPGQFKEVNYKPNYISAMNYSFQLVGCPQGGQMKPLPVDFSREAMDLLDESALDEPAGVTSTLYAGFVVPISQQLQDGSVGKATLEIGLPGAGSGDYNGDGDTVDTGVVASINDLSKSLPRVGGEVMGGFDDWVTLDWGIGGTIWNEDGTHGSVNRIDLSVDELQEAYEDFPPPPYGCRPDYNEDGTVDTRDVLAFLNLFAARKGRADYDGNNTVNTMDVLAFLNDWVAGCP